MCLTVLNQSQLTIKPSNTQDLTLFSFRKILAATDNFSPANKLGEGGFGPVYKGKLLTGEEIAVKRLSQSSGQGFKEFKTEVELIAKLQHKYLVALSGLCIHGDEKILVYEFMPNKSLDKFLFDPINQTVLNWAKRLHISHGIAQGLLYLHKHSRLKVIHRDLKPNDIQFPWFRFSYFILWTTIYVIFQWVIHASVSLWWPYPFLDLSSPHAPVWYMLVAILHIPCYAFFALVIKMKHFLLSKWFAQSYQYPK